MTSQESDSIITVSELTSGLGAVLRQVEGGSTFTVTRNGRPVAVLGPVAYSLPTQSGGESVVRETRVAYHVATSALRQPDTALTRLIGTASTRSVMTVFLRNPELALHQREIARRAGVGLRSAQIALGRLEGLGLLASERDGNRLYYRTARTERFEGLRTLLARELGVAEVIARHLSALGEQVVWASVFGSAASGDDTVSSDIDLLVVGDVTDDALVEPIAAAQRELGRDIDVVSYRPDEFAKKRAGGNHFVVSVLAKPRLDVVGGSDDI